LETLIATLSTAGNYLKVALGLGFVIFLHELGHFVLAKWNGVRVECFSIGFGPAIISYRKGVGIRVGSSSRPKGPDDPPEYGETEYCLAVVPLGGYVQMLDEEARTIEARTDPRNFQNKSVGARMAIMTAGVVMNLILGVACFAWRHTQPGKEVPAKAGGVLAGSPAYEAGFRLGDEIVAIDGRGDITFDRMRRRVSLSKANQKLRFTIKRPGTSDDVQLDIEPKRGPNADLPSIGIVMPSSLDLAAKTPFFAPPGEEVPKNPPFAGFVDEDRVVAVGAEGGPLEPVADHDALLLKLDVLRGQPIVFEVERKAKGDDAKSAAPGRVRVTVPVHRFVDLGFRSTAGPVAAVQGGSIAEKAGIKPGDRIVAINGEADLDPFRLPDKVRGLAGKPVTLTIERGDAKAKPERIELTVTPDASPTWVEPGLGSNAAEPMEIPGLGLAIRVEPKIQAVAEDSPAGKAGLKPGDVIKSMTMTFVKSDLAPERPASFSFEDKPNAWPVAFSTLQDYPVVSVKLKLVGSDKEIELQPRVVSDWYHPIRGLFFQVLTRDVAPVGVVEAMTKGLEETYENVVEIFSLFRGLSQGRVGKNVIGGLIPITQIAYTSASSGWPAFIHFLGVLSVNLAVLNFLPIPPLDGGRFLILVAEKVRGRPLPDWTLNAGTIAGFVLVLGLVLFVNVKDVFFWIQRSFFPS
jgi:regulator of sigma E protease